MAWRSLRLLCAFGLLAAFAAPACGGNAARPNSDSADGGGSGGQAGSGSSGKSSIARAGSAGTQTEPASVPCGSESCTGLVIPIQSFAVPPCCADAKTSHCGLDASVLAMFGPTFGDTCQPLDQPGTPDATCPSSPSTPVQGTAISISFPGCCRPNGTCGYQLDTIAGVFQVGLGCVDATPFLDGEAPQPCGEVGAGGAGGAGGDTGASAGASGDSSTAAGAGGDLSAGAGG